MKKSIILLCLVVVLGGCGSNVTRKSMKEVYRGDTFTLIELDSCEYVYLESAGLFSHKGNCKYCIERSKK